MTAEQPNIGLSKAILGGLFAGLVVSFIIAIFVVVYRESTHYGGFEMASALIIFSFFPLLFLLLGGLYYLLVRNLHLGTALFMGMMLLIAIFLFTIPLWHTDDIPGIIGGKKGLIMGSEFISGIAAAFLIPYFVKHLKIYQ